MAPALQKSILGQNFQLLTPPPQSLGLQFSKCQWKRTIYINHYEKWKMALALQKLVLEQGLWFSGC